MLKHKDQPKSDERCFDSTTIYSLSEASKPGARCTAPLICIKIAYFTIFHTPLREKVSQATVFIPLAHIPKALKVMS